MKILVDMNLSPAWCAVFQRNGWASVHWSTIGDPRATDETLLRWAEENGYAVLSHDLDFGAILAATQARGPSVIQVRVRDVLPSVHEAPFVNVLRQFEAQIDAGALIVVEPSRARVRILPLTS